MPETLIHGRDGTADITIDGDSYKCFIDMFRVREITEMIDTDTFCTEGQVDQEAGRSQLVGEISGVNKKGIANSGPLIPAPQDVPVVLTFSTGCTIELSANFPEASAERAVNQQSRIGARFVSKGIYTKTWVVI